MAFYLAFSGAGGIGKTTVLTWLTEQLRSSMPLVTLGDIVLPDLTQPMEEITNFLALQKLEENVLIRKYLRSGVSVLADRSCLDPLALAMTLLSESGWRALEEWYDANDFHYGHHILLTAPHCVIRGRRIARGASPRTTWLRSFNISQEEYESTWLTNWRSIHTARRIPFVEVDVASADTHTNVDAVMRTVAPLITVPPRTESLLERYSPY